MTFQEVIHSCSTVILAMPINIHGERRNQHSKLYCMVTERKDEEGKM
jgi:hypothetical protein